MINY